MKTVTIGVKGESDLVASAESDPRFKEIVAKMQSAYTNLGYIELLAFHEGAHHHYHGTFGADECALDGPCVAVTADENRKLLYYPTAAAIRVVTWNDTVRSTFSGAQLVKSAAIVGVAGAIATRVLCGVNDPFSDEGDYDAFQQICQKIGASAQVEYLWGAAKDYVAMDIEKPEVQQGIRDSANLVVKPALLALP